MFPTKITPPQKAEMAAMRKQGMTYREIAQHFSVTENRVWQILTRRTTRTERHRIDCYIFPNIAKWMNNTGTSLYRLADLTGYNATTISGYLRGLHDAPLTFIKALLEVSGMTFEEAFETKKPRRAAQKRKDIEHG